MNSQAPLDLTHVGIETPASGLNLFQSTTEKDLYLEGRKIPCETGGSLKTKNTMELSWYPNSAHLEFLEQFFFISIISLLFTYRLLMALESGDQPAIN